MQVEDYVRNRVQNAPLNKLKLLFAAVPFVGRARIQAFITHGSTLTTVGIHQPARSAAQPHAPTQKVRRITPRRVGLKPPLALPRRAVSTAGVLDGPLSIAVRLVLSVQNFPQEE